MTSQYLLCLNAGSSSLKFKLFDLGTDGGKSANVDQLQVTVSGSAKPKGETKTALTIKGDKEVSKEVDSGLTSPEVVERILKVLSSTFNIKSESIKHVSHRVVHGAHLPNCLEISSTDTGNLKTIEFLTSFAPLHNASATSMIKSVLKMLPKAINYACFDTAFHVASMDPIQYRYPVREDAAGKGLPGGMSLRKWGFHGLSYSSVTRSVSRFLKKDIDQVNLIICHLGSGASICAIKGGKSFDTSMGLTPLEGLPGSSRAGSIDPTLSHHILPSKEAPTQHSQQDSTQETKLKVKVGEAEVDWAEYTLNTESGFKALAGTGDFAEIVEKRESDENCRLAFAIFVDRIIGFLGSYAFKLTTFGGVHAVVISGGIGEACPELREALAGRLVGTPLTMPSSWPPWDDDDTVSRMKSSDKNIQSGYMPWLICKTNEEEECTRQVVGHLQAK